MEKLTRAEKHEQELRKAMINRYIILDKVMSCPITFKMFIRHSEFNRTLFHRHSHAIFRTFAELKEAAKNKR